VLERAPKEERGGNTRFSNGAIRAVSEPGARGLRDAPTKRLRNWWLIRARTRSKGFAVSALSLMIREQIPGTKAQLLAIFSLIEGEDGIRGVRVARGRRRVEITGDAVLLAAGGFEANPRWRAAFLGPGWDLAEVRGSRFNAGDGLRMALDAERCPTVTGLAAIRLIGTWTRPIRTISL
jgi:hypothetical protein